ncbi:MAG: hypothetical protein KW793_01275 [Candidatus Doudnabacteria bacterium]|nr:hypothetical protein [Candidatus Doudnabacteria bacterium]
MNRSNTKLPEVRPQENKIDWFSRHYMWGYGFLFLSFLLAVAFIYQLEYGKKKEARICIQLITPAKNFRTGEISEFPTPCDVPEGWQPIDTTVKDGNVLNNVN